MKKNKISFTTNTAYLLNAWFPDDSNLFPKVKDFIKEAHQEHWKGKVNGFVEVTLKFREVQR